MNGLDQQILDAIKAKPGQKARDLAQRLGVDRRIVNSTLYGSLRGKVKSDGSYRWYLKDTVRIAGKVERSGKLDTSLSRLCRYYLDCLSHEDLGEISRPVFRIHDEFIELPVFPTFDDNASDPFDSEDARRLLAKVNRDRNPKTFFLGYPVRLKWVRSRKGWEGFMVEPLLLFPFREQDSRRGRPSISEELPQINFGALRSLSNAGASNLMEEAVQLAEELGLGNAGDDQPELDELLARLREIRPDWDWQEEPVPDALSVAPPLADLGVQGIYNRAILVAAERPPYTKGLESELGKLQCIEEDDYRSTSLGAWLSQKTIESPPSAQQPLLEVLPLNGEQRQVVRQALSNPLTVVTGPPGTGKSQVVMSILVNAAWQGKTVLFASKNNKAVDVVETRVNALGPRPVLLRLGANQYQGRLAEYLVSLMASTATADDEARYSEFRGIHAQLQNRSEALDAEFESVVSLRNEVDRLEQSVEVARGEVGESVFRLFRGIAIDEITKAVDRLQVATVQADYRKQLFFIRLFWPALCNERFARLATEGDAFGRVAQELGISAPDHKPDSSTIDQWVQFCQQAQRRLTQAAAVCFYAARLADLANIRPLDELSRQRLKLTDDLAANSESLWEAWLRLQPARMTPEQRKLLGEYSTSLQMIVSADGENRAVGGDVRRRFNQLFPKIMPILPCWAVTSLSARGRVPFEPNFFDLLVIDEASQCDIASALPLLFRARGAVIIGDPMQLRHITPLSTQQDQQLLSKHQLVDEHLNWDYSVNSLYHLASSLCREEDIVNLRDHHRSHADIIEFSNKTFYGGRLRIATKYDRLNRPRSDGPAVRWINVQGTAIRPGTGGAVNEVEALAVVKEIERLISQGYRGSIGVVSPFRAQANRIRDLAYGSELLARHLAEVDFLSDAIHSFQGDERDVMIFSPAVTDSSPRGAIWFLQKYPNLFNVAVTRARASLIVVGDKSAAMNCGVDHLSRFAAYVDQLGTDRPHVDDGLGADFGPDYPTVSHPERVSEWEHFFYRALYRSGIRSVPQYQVEQYCLDFAIIEGSRRLNIEIDGEYYHRNWDGELCRRDQIRNQRLMELGWDVIRFWVYQIRDDLDTCLAKVSQWINQSCS